MTEKSLTPLQMAAAAGLGELIIQYEDGSLFGDSLEIVKNLYTALHKDGVDVSDFDESVSRIDEDMIAGDEDFDDDDDDDLDDDGSEGFGDDDDSVDYDTEEEDDDDDEDLYIDEDDDLVDRLNGV